MSIDEGGDKNDEAKDEFGQRYICDLPGYSAFVDCSIPDPERTLSGSGADQCRLYSSCDISPHDHIGKPAAHTESGLEAGEDRLHRDRSFQKRACIPWAVGGLCDSVLLDRVCDPLRSICDIIASFSEM